MIRLDTSQEPPYQLMIDGQLSGLSVSVLDCIFSRLRQPHDIQLTSWKRAKHNVSTHLSEGFFSSAPDAEADAFAELSAPLLIEKWYWYALDPQILNRPPWDPQLRIGAVLGSNTLAWLETRGINVQQTVPRLEQLLQLLQRGRIDMILADQDVMSSALPTQQPALQLQQRFVRYSPLGVYFSRTYLEHNSGFLPAFNQQVQSCAPSGSPLSDLERHHLKQLVHLHLQRWGHHQTLLDSLRQNAEKPLQPADISSLDRQWREELESPQQPLIDSVRQLPASALLEGIQRQYAPLFNELFLTDQRGLIAGMSENTSDYWQGDEAKFSSVRTLKPNQLLIEPISYDGSTQSFQVQVSAPLHEPQSGDFLGVLTFGINIEAAFGDSQP
ncbi:transporter substrate-binding domain-containing protein [Pseudomonas sp. UL070]|uniref:Transporter substrate-binding domain-containing protein n=2 Tax=Aquipseudomonas ullengensis TaxID=2759166 RepID=A0A7W4LPN7_9GAMM|nr:transporter substrate-binding domain-containing protein [Pseudomonas ullengensis]